MARSKTRKPRKSRKSRKFFPRFLNLSFRFCPTAKIENSEQYFRDFQVPTNTNTSQYESTRVNTSQTRVNTNQHESDTSQHKPDTSQHESVRVRHESTRINTSQHESTRASQTMKLSQFIVVQLINYDNSLIGLNITFSLSQSQNQKRIKNKLDAIQTQSKFS